MKKLSSADATKHILTAFLTLLELHEVEGQKNDAVRRQDFEMALLHREKENELKSSLPNASQLKKFLEDL